MVKYTKQRLLNHEFVRKVSEDVLMLHVFVVTK
jgi:hypothetical protein